MVNAYNWAKDNGANKEWLKSFGK